MNGGVCRSCQAPIVWATTERGKKMPVDAEPHPDGNLVLVDPTGPEPRVVGGRTAAAMVGQPKHFSHFSTCPERDVWRKPRGGDA